MSSFTTPAVLEMLDDYKWRVANNFDYYTDVMPERVLIHVPIDTISDLASVPRVLWSVFPPFGRYAKAAIIHDYLYENALFSKEIADLIFYEAMGVLCVPIWRKKIMYWSVRLFGRGNYSKKGKK